LILHVLNNSCYKIHIPTIVFTPNIPNNATKSITA
jgi:hypothetical protein